MAGGMRSIIAAAAMTVLVLTGGRSRAAERAVLTFVLHVSNQAGTASADRAQAQAQTDRIFKDIGVRIVWSDVGDRPYDPGCAGFNVLVTLLSADMVRQLSSQGLRENVLGSASYAAGRAFIHPGRISKLGARTRSNAGELIGRVIAHEIGHLMLPAGHSPTGIMAAGVDTDPASMSTRFTVPQSRAIRALLESKANTLEGRGTCGN